MAIDMALRAELGVPKRPVSVVYSTRAPKGYRNYSSSSGLKMYRSSRSFFVLWRGCGYRHGAPNGAWGFHFVRFRMRFSGGGFPVLDVFDSDASSDQRDQQ